MGGKQAKKARQAARNSGRIETRGIPMRSIGTNPLAVQHAASLGTAISRSIYSGAYGNEYAENWLRSLGRAGLRATGLTAQKIAATRIELADSYLKADTIWADRAATELIVEEALSSTGRRVSSANLPSAEGLLVFERPLTFTEIGTPEFADELYDSVSALYWQTGVGRNPEGKPASFVTVEAWSDVDGVLVQTSYAWTPLGMMVTGGSLTLVKLIAAAELIERTGRANVRKRDVSTDPKRRAEAGFTQLLGG